MLIEMKFSPCEVLHDVSKSEMMFDLKFKLGGPIALCFIMDQMFVDLVSMVNVCIKFVCRLQGYIAITVRVKGD